MMRLILGAAPRERGPENERRDNEDGCSRRDADQKVPLATHRDYLHRLHARVGLVAEAPSLGRAFRNDALSGFALFGQDVVVHEDLELVEARWRLGLIQVSDLHRVASDLLDGGVISDSLVDLFALAPDAVAWRGAELFDRVLDELVQRRTTEAEAAQVVARCIASDVLSGAVEPEEATALAGSIYLSTDCRFDQFVGLYVLDEEMSYLDAQGRSYLGRKGTEVAKDVRAEAARILGIELGPS